MPWEINPMNSAWLLITTLAIAVTRLPADDRESRFESTIRPLLAKHCIGCHGPDKQKVGLRLDDKAGWAKGGDSGPAILPGKPAESLLVKAVRREASVSAMPPNRSLSPAEVRDLEAWVAAGAFDPREGSERLGGMSLGEAKSWWAFQPLAKSSPPGPGHPIDAFLQTRLAKAGMAYQKPAAKQDILRRLSYDLTGLPPTPPEMDSFLSDDSPQGYEKVVDRLLSTPAYGERWGRHWLDLARYADTAGENSDFPISNAWRYRNWVIDAFNRDMPYDKFIRAQIAGDLLAPNAADIERDGLVVATGFLAVARRFGHNIASDMHLTREDVIDTVGRTFLGLSLGCARCHDHKYDPITTRDYYALYGIFESTRFPFPGCEANRQPRDMVPLPGDPARVAETLKADARIAAIESEKAKIQAGLPRLDFSGARPVASGSIKDGGSARLNVPSPVRMVKGDMLLLAISPLANQGADFTRVELKLSDSAHASKAWDLRTEAINSFPKGNPVASSHGGAWHFLDLQKQPRLLNSRTDGAYGNENLMAWRSEGETPAAMVNTSPDPVQVFAKLPGRSFFAHPGASWPVGIGFLCPADGNFTIDGSLVDAHPGGPDGVGFNLSVVPAGFSAALARHVEAASTLSKLESEKSGLLSRKRPSEFAYAVAELKPVDAAVQVRGEPEKKGPIVPRGMPALLGGTTVSATNASGRLELANWLASASNPLAARVIANRIWLHHFGSGIVATPSDFGSRGLKPTHPELLDWLARDFVENGCKIKRLHKLIVTSKAYRQSAGPPDDRDPDNQLVSRFARRRLSAEEIRDSLLVAAGKLDSDPGASHPFPPEDSWRFTQHNPFAAEYDTNKRAIYQMTTRNRRHPFFALFDGADPNATTPVRQATTVPTQALYFMNDPLVHDAAMALASRVEAEPTTGAQLSLLFRIALQRPPTDPELAAIRLLVPSASARLDTRSLASAARVVLSGNSFLTVD